MPSKAKNGKSSSKKNKKGNKESSNEKTEWDDLDITTLEQSVTTLKNEYQTSLQDRVKFQTEYESMYQAYYESTKQNVSTMELEIKAKQLEVEDAIHDQNVEIEIYTEKEQFIQYDHDQNLNNVNEERIQYIQDEESKNESKLFQNEENQLALKLEIKERGIVYLEEIKNIQEKLRRELVESRDRLDLQLKALQDACINEYEEIQNELHAQSTTELSVMTDQNNLHIHELSQRHEERYTDAKAYFAKVSKENTAKTQGLTEESEKVDSLISDYERQSKLLHEENRQLSGPLSEYISKVRYFDCVYSVFMEQMFSMKFQCYHYFLRIIY